MEITVDIRRKSDRDECEVAAITFQGDQESDEPILKNLAQNEWLDINGARFYPRHSIQSDTTPSTLFFISADVTTTRH